VRTIVYNIKVNSDRDFIEQKLNDHANCTRFIYKKLEESTDKNLLDYCKTRFKLNDSEVRSIVSNVTQIRNSFLAKIKKTEEEIIDLQEDIEELESKIVKIKTLKVTEKRTEKLKALKKKLFKLTVKLAKKQRFIKSDIVFGSRKLLNDISYLSNNKEVNSVTIESKKESYTNKRKGSIFIIDEANQKGNRFFDFDLANKTIVYKPFKGKKVILTLCNRTDKFESQIQVAIENKQIAITVSLTNDVIYLSYDEAALNGFTINKTDRKNEVKEATKFCTNKAEHEAIVKAVYHSYFQRLRDKQLSNKLSNRYLGIDLNPEYIGYSIIDKLDNGEIKVIKAGCFDFSGLTKKTGLASSHPLSVKRNNKRKHERKEVVCELFSLMKHYKVGTFIMEDLDFKTNNKTEAKEFNRKVKNIWDRELLSTLIKKKCAEGGFIFDVINPVYTSLIGNLSYRVFDPVTASLEITRRGSAKYDKGGFFPIETTLTIHTMEVVARRNHIDVELIRDVSWKERYTILNGNVKFRYRWGKSVGRADSLSLKSYKSKTIQYLYCL